MTFDVTWWAVAYLAGGLHGVVLWCYLTGDD